VYAAFLFAAAAIVAARRQKIVIPFDDGP